MEERWLLYLDFLGTSEIFKETDANSDSIKIQAFEKIIDHISKNNSHYYIRDVGHQRQLSPEYTSFSDHLAVSYPLECDMVPNKKPEESKKMERECFVFPVLIKFLLQYANDVYDMALKNGFLVRGAIVRGKLYHVGNKIYGPAIISAVKLEEEIAEYPRIIIPDDIAHFFQDRYNPIHMAQDFDGVFYFNFFKRGPIFPKALSNPYDIIPTLKEYKAQIEKNVTLLELAMNKETGEKKKKVKRALEKWKWIAEKFDDSLDYYATYFIKEFPDIKNSLNAVGKVNAQNKFTDRDTLCLPIPMSAFLVQKNPC